MKIIRPQAITTGMLTSNIPESDYPEYSPGTTYAISARVISTSTHRVYESLQNSNTGNPLPAAGAVSTLYWLDVGATNRWKMFDNSVTSQSQQADLIEVSIQTSGRVDSVALLNVSASEVRIQMQDVSAGLVYDETYSLVSDSGVDDWYEYFFEPIDELHNFAISNMDLYSDTDITISITSPGGIVKCGACIVGLSRDVGATQYGASIGIADYSVKTTDDFGNKTILERDFADTQSLQVMVKNTSIDQLKRMLASLRATPVVYIGSDIYGCSIIYGFYQDFKTVISYPNESILNIEIEGLT